MFRLLKRVSSLSFLYGVSSVSYQVTGIILLPLYTRLLTPTEYGIYGISLVFILFFEVFVNMGIPAAFFRFLYDYKDEKEKHELMSTSYVFVTSTSLLIVFFLFVLRDYIQPSIFISEEYYGCFYLMTLMSLFESPQTLAFNYFRAVEQPKKYCVLNFIRSGVLLISSWVFLVPMGKGIYGLFLARVVCSLPAYLYLNYLLLSQYGIKVSPGKLKAMYRYGFPFFLVNIMGAVMASVDRPLLLKYMSMADVGIYTAAFRVASGVKFLIVNAFALGWSPMIMSIKAQKDNQQIFSKFFTYYLLAAGAVVLGVSLFSRELLTLLVAPEYVKAYSVIPFLCLSFFFYGIYNNLEVGLFITKQSKYYIPIMAVSSIAYVCLNAALIPRLGYIGAGVASALSYMIIPLLTFFVGRRLYFIKYEYGRILKIAFAMMASYAAGILVSVDGFMMNMVKDLCAISIFPVLLLFCGFFERKEIFWIKEKVVAGRRVH